ncbi:MAG: response regulator [Phycisphaerales bacterium]|nr:response regulator [Phycisphaerales bacterium]
MSATTTHRKILLFSKPGSISDSVVSQFGEDVEVHQVSSFEDALTALREGSYDLIISDQGNFMALERSAVDRHATMILDTIDQGVCIVDSGGSLVCANPRMRQFPEDLITQVSEICLRAFGQSADRDSAAPAYTRARRFSLTAGDDQYFEVTITPILSEGEKVTQFTAVVWDVTHSRRLQKKIDAIDLAGRELVRLDAETTAGMDVEERISLLERKMLRYMHDLLHYDNFAVLLIDKKTNRLEIVLQHGMSEQTRHLDMYSSTEGNGISGYVAATGRSYICHDTSKDPRYIQGLATAKSSLTVPLRLHDKVIGVFDVESDRLAAFNEDDRQFAEILARYVALVLHMLDLLIIERYESTGQVADDVTDEIAGPLSDIITEASNLKDEYIGHDDLRHRLNAIIDHVGEIKSKVKDVATQRAGILGRHGDTTVRDPILEAKHVLIADDEEIIRETIGGVLKKSGCVVKTARDGVEAIAMLQENRFDLVLADIKMPSKDGYEVFAAARDQNADCAVILMTGFGYDPNHSIVRARKEGLNAVLFKPFKVDQLLGEIRAAFQPKA